MKRMRVVFQILGDVMVMPKQALQS
jgi:hypothetical protein